MGSPESEGAAFRRKATGTFRTFVVVLTVLAIGLAVLGWWLGSWWGLAVGAAVGLVVWIGGMVGGVLFWAMSQDGA